MEIVSLETRVLPQATMRQSSCAELRARRAFWKQNETIKRTSVSSRSLHNKTSLLLYSIYRYNNDPQTIVTYTNHGGRFES